MKYRKKLSVGLFIDNYYPIVDGVVSVVDNYSKSLNNIGDKTTVFTPAPKDKNYDDSIHPYNIYRTKSVNIPFLEYPLADCKHTKDLSKEFKNKKYEILHCHSPFMMGHFALKMAHKYHIPLVTTFHSKYYDDFKQALGSAKLARIAVKKIVDFYNECDAVWTLNRACKKTLRSYGYKGPVTIIPNGTNYKMPKDSNVIKEKVRNKYNIHDNEKIILFVAHLIWQKNIKTVLDTFKILEEKDSTYRLIMVGGGGHEEEVKKYAKDIGLKKCEFVGKISDKKELQGMYLNAKLFFFPSIYDNFPIVVNEASAMELPALLIEGSNAAEPIKDGINGFLGPNDAKLLAEKIEYIFANEQLRINCGKLAAKTISQSWTRLIPVIHSEYEEIIAEYRLKHRDYLQTRHENNIETRDVKKDLKEFKLEEKKEYRQNHKAIRKEIKNIKHNHKKYIKQKE